MSVRVTVPTDAIVKAQFEAVSAARAPLATAPAAALQSSPLSTVMLPAPPIDCTAETIEGRVLFLRQRRNGLSRRVAAHRGVFAQRTAIQRGELSLGIQRGAENRLPHRFADELK